MGFGCVILFLVFVFCTLHLLKLLDLFPPAESKEKPAEAEAAAATQDMPKLSKFGKSSESRDSEFTQQHSADLDWLCSEVGTSGVALVCFFSCLLREVLQVKYG